VEEMERILEYRRGMANGFGLPVKDGVGV